MSHRWTGVNIVECADCHLLARHREMHLSDAVPCEHIWRASVTGATYECDCGEVAAFLDMLDRTFLGHCPIVGPTPTVPPMTASQVANAAFNIPLKWNAATGRVVPVSGTALMTPGYFGPAFDYPNEKEETNPPGKYPKCRGCGVDLCAVLDAYYGKDPALVGKCERCRGRRQT